MIRPLIIFLIFICASIASNSQEPVTIQFTPVDSYLPSTVYFILKDRHEIIWIATRSGVYQYDGYNFHQYTSADGLGDNEILRIYEDKKGRIWFQSVNGNPSFYLDGKIYNSSNNTMLSKLKFNKMILSECEDAAGNLYISSREFVYFKISPDDEVTKLAFRGEDNFMWFHNQQVHFVVKKMYNSYKPVRGDTWEDLVMFGLNHELYEVYDDTIYKQVLTLPENCKEIIFVRIKNNNEIFIGTRNGLFIWYRDGSKPLRHILENVSVSSVEFDFEENVWVSTLEAGVFLIPSLDVNIYAQKSGLQKDHITCIEKDSLDNLWVGMSEDYYAIIHPDGNIEKFRLSAGSTLNITNIRHFNKDTYIISKSSLLQIEGKKQRELNIYGNDLLVQSNGNFLLGQDNTILLKKDLFEMHLEEIINNLSYKRKDFELLNARTNVIRQEKNGTVWLGTSRGLYQYRDIILSFGEVDPVFNYPVRDIAFDTQNKFVFVATLNGLLVIKDEKLFSVFDQHSHLPNSECNAVYTDDENSLWAAFGNELVKINFDNTGFHIKNISDQLKLETNRIGDIDMVGDIIYLSTETGLIYFNSKSINNFQAKPILSFSDVLINDRSILNTSARQFNYDENDVTISYSGISYLSRTQIKYEYFLNGYDNEWQQTSERTIHYKSLSPGTYNFEIRAINKAGIISETQSFTFEILSPFWNRLWFRLACIGLISFIIAILWRFRLRIVRKKYEQENKTIRLEMENVAFEKKLSELEQQAFRQQMNPHFIFNALNTIKGYYAENDVKKANDYISKFSKLLRTILENSKYAVTLEAEIESVKLYLELAGMRYENKFLYSINVSNEINREETNIPSMLLQPFIENALIHGISPKAGMGYIHIFFRKEGDKLICEITDNGIGRTAASEKSKSAEHQSKATAIITEYLKALNKKDQAGLFTIQIIDLFDSENISSGTRVIISMPYSKIW